MNDSIGTNWVLLIHRLPPKPDYLRVKVRRRLERLGALPIKSSVYVLPMRDDTLEDLQWVAHEIAGDGGEATICGASFLSGTTDEDLRAAFIEAREAEYRDIAAAAATIESGSEAGIARLTKRLAAASRLDWFDAPGRRAAEVAIRSAEERLRGPAAGADSSGSAVPGATRGLVWVTRAGVFVDRMASAWLIRRFIDPDARFSFVSATRHTPALGEVRFDMFDAEYTHEGERCTFEVLLDRFALDDAALGIIAQIVHDIDLKDDKFGRPETSGVAAMLEGIAATTADDAERLARGSSLFDSLYATFAAAR